MQCCPSEHQIFLPTSVTFCFGSVSLFFLELFLHSSPVAYWAPTDPGSSFFSVISFLPFHTVWFQIGNGVCQCYILSSCLFKLYAEYIMQNSRLDEAQATIKIVRRNINNLRYADDTTLMARSEEKRKCLLIKVKEVSEKVGLKVSTPKTKIMASGPITS